MQARSTVEIADRLSRRRAFGVAVAALVFLVIQFVARPLFIGAGIQVSETRHILWAINAGILMLLLATGGGLLQRAPVRALINDEVSRLHSRTAMLVGYWIAMSLAFALYFIPALSRLTARESMYLIITASVAIPLLVFAYLEYRAHGDG